MTRLTPSFFRVAANVETTLVFFFVLCFFLYGNRDGKGWTNGDFSLVIPIIVMPVGVWFMFVPRLIEFSETEITISTLVGTHTYQWEDLYAYGPGRGVYKIQFSGDNQPYQIFKGAYSSVEWAKLIDFMTGRFPDRVSSVFSIGPWMKPRGDR